MCEYIIQTDKFKICIRAAEVEEYVKYDDENEEYAPFTYCIAYDEDEKTIGYFENVVWFAKKSLIMDVSEVRQ